MAAASDRTARIRALNDALRTTFTGGMVMQTNGIAALAPELVGKIPRWWNTSKPPSDSWRQGL